MDKKIAIGILSGLGLRIRIVEQDYQDWGSMYGVVFGVWDGFSFGWIGQTEF